MAVIKRRDFVEIGYTGTIKDNRSVFDKSEKLVICLGENSLPKGLEEQIIGKETGMEYYFEISPDNAFGQKDTKLIQMIPLSRFRQQGIQPVPGLQLNIDGIFGVVRTVSGGRCLVDFNHPLAGRDLLYTVNIKKLVEDDKEKLGSLISLHLNIKDAEIVLIESKEGTAGVSASIKTKQPVPNKAQEEFKKIAANLIPTIKDVEFIHKD